jgi:hypothetical protein
MKSSEDTGTGGTRTVFSALHRLCEVNGGRALMGKSDEYRRYADECLELASTFQFPETRAVLLHMAQVWFRLADREEASSTASAEGDPGYR